MNLSSLQEQKKPMARVIPMGTSPRRRTASTVAPIAAVIGCPHLGCWHAFAGPDLDTATRKLEAHYAFAHMPTKEIA